MKDVRAIRIAEINDMFRTNGIGFMITRGIQGLKDVNGLLNMVREHDTFTEDNDPYGEHDFGQLWWNGVKIFWKIDYYDRALKFWEDPLSPNCRRVITVMLAEEY